MIAGLKMACEEQVQGSLGYGPADWMILYQTHRIYITEGKKDSVAQGLHQNWHNWLQQRRPRKEASVLRQSSVLWNCHYVQRMGIFAPRSSQVTFRNR